MSTQETTNKFLENMVVKADSGRWCREQLLEAVIEVS
jgi:hypothetical protein